MLIDGEPSSSQQRVLRIFYDHARRGADDGWCELPVRAKAKPFYIQTPLVTVRSLIGMDMIEPRGPEGNPTHARITEKGKAFMAGLDRQRSS